jgi:hypothetical protein
MAQKDIVFYSTLCSYSNEVVGIIKDSNLEKELMLINIDDNQIKLPDFIKVVPTIYLTKDKTLIIDEEIITWIENKKKVFSSSVNGYNDNSFSDFFSGLDNGDAQHNGDFFSSINDDVHIEFTKEEENIKKKLNFQDIQDQRTNDLKELYN